MASESEPPEPITAPFSIGTTDAKPRRIIKARRPPRRSQGRAATNTTVEAISGAAAETSNDGSEEELSLSSLESVEDDSEEEDEDLASRVFNVVSPLMVQNRFDCLEDDDDSISTTSSIPQLENDCQSVAAPTTFIENTNKSRRKKSKKAKKKSKKNNSKKTPQQTTTDTNEQLCSICIEPDEPNSTWSNLVILPCCGSATSPSLPPKELNFSTRFCSGCILKLTRVNLDKESVDEYAPWEDLEFPTTVFYGERLDYNDVEIIECPRCRVLIGLVCEGASEDESEECDCRDCRIEKRKRRLDECVEGVEIIEPSFLSRVNYVGRKRGMAQLLWRVAFSPLNVITVEGLGGKDEVARISKLVGWGIMKKNGDGFYSIKREEQETLLRLFDSERRDSDSSDEEYRDSKMFQQFMPCLIWAWLDLLRRMRLVKAFRIWNHTCMLQYHISGRLPPLPLNVAQNLVVTGLNIFCTCIFLRLSLALVIHGGLFFASIIIVCKILRFAGQFDQAKSNAILACLLIGGLGYFINRALAFTQSHSIWYKMIGLMQT